MAFAQGRAASARPVHPGPACGLPPSPAPPPDHTRTAEARMKAREIMTKDPRTVTPDTGLQEVARLMQSEDVGIIPVVEAGGTSLLGVVTDRDIALRVVAEGKDATSTKVS